MKINLECLELRPGYLNTNSNKEIENIAKQAGVDFAVCDPRSLDSVVEDETAEEIIGNHLLNRVHPNEIVPVVGNWIKKLAHGGRLVVSFIDIRKTCRLGFLDEVPLEDLHKLIFGMQNENQSVCDIQVIKTMLQRFGMNIKFITSKDHIVLIEAQKP